MRKIILASGSPRRKELLSQIIGNNFEKKESSYEEDNTLPMDPLKLVLHHSLKKGLDVAKNYDSGIVISADTIVAFEGNVLGKPHTAEVAIQTLKKLNGKKIDVITGLTVIDIDKNIKIQAQETSIVKMQQMTDDEINLYVQSGEPLDKAGAFGVQGKGAIFVERVDGCYSNVVGLPLFKLGQILKKLDISIFDFQ